MKEIKWKEKIKFVNIIRNLQKINKENKYNKKCSNSYLFIVNILIVWYNLTGVFY